MDDEQSDEEEDEADTAVGRMATDSDDVLALDELSARMEDEQREEKLQMVKLEAIEVLCPFPSLTVRLPPLELEVRGL